MDALDLSLKAMDVIFFLDVRDEQEEFFLPLSIALTLCVVITVLGNIWRVRELHEMHFLAKHGYSYRWKAEDRIVGSTSGEDPRVKRDLKERNKRHQILQSFQAIFVVGLQGLRRFRKTCCSLFMFCCYLSRLVWNGSVRWLDRAWSCCRCQ